MNRLGLPGRMVHVSGHGLGVGGGGWGVQAINVTRKRHILIRKNINIYIIIHFFSYKKKTKIYINYILEFDW